MSRNKYPDQTEKLILDVSQKLFLEKGYENTSIQDIIGALGGLSKGAIYHHFKSKEDIFNAVGDRFNKQIILDLEAVRDDPDLNGCEKLKKMFSVSLSTPERDIVYTVAPNLLENPKLLVFQIQEIFQEVVPHFVQPVIEQGIRDGSIQTEFPKELSETIVLLANIWLNPMVIEADAKTLEGRVRFFASLLRGLGMDLLDGQMLESYLRYCSYYGANRSSFPQK